MRTNSVENRGHDLVVNQDEKSLCNRHRLQISHVHERELDKCGRLVAHQPTSSAGWGRSTFVDSRRLRSCFSLSSRSSTASASRKASQKLVSRASGRTLGKMAVERTNVSGCMIHAKSPGTTGYSADEHLAFPCVRRVSGMICGALGMGRRGHRPGGGGH